MSEFSNRCTARVPDLQSCNQTRPITPEYARRLEHEGRWQEAADIWKTLSQVERGRGGNPTYYEEQCSACEMLVYAIEEGDKFREMCKQKMRDINALPEEEKRHLSWQIKGYCLGMLTKDARREVEEFFNEYPRVPKQTIINWGLEYYDTWSV